MALHQIDQEMVKDITRMGVRAGVLLRGVMLQKVDEETLRWGLRELAPGDLLSKYMPALIHRPECVHLLNILHLTYSLDGQLDFRRFVDNLVFGLEIDADTCQPEWYAGDRMDWNLAVGHLFGCNPKPTSKPTMRSSSP